MIPVSERMDRARPRCCSQLEHSDEARRGRVTWLVRTAFKTRSALMLKEDIMIQRLGRNDKNKIRQPTVAMALMADSNGLDSTYFELLEGATLMENKDK